MVRKLSSLFKSEFVGLDKLSDFFSGHVAGGGIHCHWHWQWLELELVLSPSAAWPSPFLFSFSKLAEEKKEEEEVTTRNEEEELIEGRSTLFAERP